MDQIVVIILPFFISAIIEYVPSLSITYGIDKETIDGDKVKFLTAAYKTLVFVVTLIVMALGVMSSFPNSDFLKLFPSTDTYTLISSFLNTTRTQDDYWLMLSVLSLMSVVTPALFYFICKHENKPIDDNKSKELLRNLIIRISMFLVGAFVAWMAIIVLFKTPFEILDRIPVLLLMVYLIILLCLRINFRFQIKADRDEEKNPSLLGCIPIFCSAVWCSFVYAVFGISFLISFSTHRHISDFVAQHGIYDFWGSDCRIILIMASIGYVVLFILTSNKGFRGNAWYVFAIYVVAVSNMVLFPMIAIEGKRTLNALLLLFTFMFLYFCFRKIKKQEKDNKQTEEYAVGEANKKSFREKLKDIKEKIEPWTILTVGIALLIVLVAEVLPLVKSIGL